MDNFSIYSVTTPTKENISITFTPSYGCLEYTYHVYKNDEIYLTATVLDGTSKEILLETSGRYYISVNMLINGETVEARSGEYIVDKQAPELRVGETDLHMRVGDKLDLWGNVKALDNIDGDLTTSINTNFSSLTLNKPGKQKLIYDVVDKAGNTTSKMVNLTITNNQSYLLATVQIAVIVLLLITINRLSTYLRLIKLEKRYAKYAIEPLNDTTQSVFEIMFWFGNGIIKTLSQVIKKSKLLVRYSKRFNKYLIFTKDKYDNALDIVSLKILCSIGFLVLAVIAKALQYKTLTVYEVSVPLILGFFVIDILYFFKYRLYYDKIENDLLQAVIIMNNAFKSGRSIVQAISLVSEELPGIVGEQFNLMKKELSKGLALDVVFERFAERINIEEVNYLTASLTILNKTGGNIIKVFSSIENSLFMKKKLKLELKSLTSSSRIIMWVLFFIPIVYVFIISILNPTYFDPFFKNPLGLLLLIVSIIFYIIYIFIVRKILKVRM